VSDGEGIDDEFLSADERRGLAPPRFLAPYRPSSDPIWQLPSDGLPPAATVHIAARIIAMVLRDGLSVEEAANMVAQELAPEHGGDTAAELQLFGGVPASVSGGKKPHMHVDSLDLTLEQFDDASDDRFAPWEWARGIPGATMTAVVDIEHAELREEYKTAIKSGIANLIKTFEPGAQDAAASNSKPSSSGEGASGVGQKLVLEPPPMEQAMAIAKCAADAVARASNNELEPSVLQGPLAFVPEWRGQQWVWTPCCVLDYTAPEGTSRSANPLGYDGRFLVQKLVLPAAMATGAAHASWRSN